MKYLLIFKLLITLIPIIFSYNYSLLEEEKYSNFIVNSTNFSFYFSIDISKYATNEEGALALFIEKITESKLKIECSLIFCLNEQDFFNNSFIHIYFVKTNNEYESFDLKIEFEEEIKEQKCEIVLAKKFEIIENNTKIISKIGVPKYLKISKNDEKFNFNPIIYSFNENFQTVFYGNLIVDNKINKKYTNVIIAFSEYFKNLSSNNFITFRLFNPAIDSIETLINFYGADFIFYPFYERKIQSLDFSFKNCIRLLYLIGSYETKTNDLIYLDVKYGNTTILYKNNLEGNSMKEILPNLNSTKITNYDLLNSQIDLFKFECNTPSFVNVNFMRKKPESKSYKIGQKIYFYIENEEIISLEFEENFENLGYEISLLSNSNIKVNFNDEEYKIFTKSERGKIENGKEKYKIEFENLNSYGTFIGFKTGIKNMFYKIEINQEEKELNYQNLLFILPENKEKFDYFSIEIEINDKKIIENFLICKEFGIGIEPYFNLPLNDCEKIKEKNIFQLENPYDKAFSKETETEKYYFTLHFKNNNNNNDDLKYKIKYFSHDKKIYDFLEKNTFYFGDFFSNVKNVHNNSNSDLKFLMKVEKCGENEFEIKRIIDNEEYEKQIVKNKRNMILLNNFLIDASISVNVNNSNFLFSYDFVSVDDYKNFNAKKTNDFSIKNKNNKFYFFPFILDEIVNYSIFIYEENQLKNFDDCELMKREPNLTMSKKVSNQNEIDFSFELKKNGFYTINIIAEQIEGLKSKFSYDRLTFEFKKKSSSNSFFYVLLVLIIIIIIAIIIILLYKKIKKLRERNEYISFK